MASKDAVEWVRWSLSAMLGTGPQCLAWTATERTVCTICSTITQTTITTIYRQRPQAEANCGHNGHMAVVDNSSLQVDSQPKSGGLVWGLEAAWSCSTFTKWTEWTLAMTLIGHSTINIVVVIIILFTDKTQFIYSVKYLMLKTYNNKNTQLFNGHYWHLPGLVSCPFWHPMHRKYLK